MEARHRVAEHREPRVWVAVETCEMKGEAVHRDLGGLHRFREGRPDSFDQGVGSAQNTAGILKCWASAREKRTRTFPWCGLPHSRLPRKEAGG